LHDSIEAENETLEGYFTAAMNAIAIVQARMGSTRLPGKVLKDLGGESVLARVVRRLRRSVEISQVIIATTILPADEAIVRECDRLKLACFRGSDSDVLDRYYRAAQAFRANTVVRITSDCPLIDPALVDTTIKALFRENVDYATNANPRTFPRGLDAEAFTFAALDRARSEAIQSYEREHVTPYFYEHPELFRLASVENSVDQSIHRWTLDTKEDLALIREIYLRFGNRDDFSWEEALAAVEREPELAELNANTLQKSLH
jgi:spore coat polysaccharide biosynthesis protein SpsF